MSAVRTLTTPAGWATATIGELIDPNGEFTDGDWVESKDQDPSGDVRLIQLADVGDGAYLDRSNRFLTSGKADELRCTFLQPGDILIARMPDPLGRACLFPGDAKRAVTVVDVCIVRTASVNVDHRWLMWTLNAPQFRSEIAALQSGSTRKRISRGNLAKLRLPIPPTKEQVRIAEVVERHLTRIDAAVAGLERVKSQLARYRASVLNAACEGRLVPTEAEIARAEGRTYEPAERVIARSKLAECSEREGRLPEGWCWVSLEDLASRITSGSRDWKPYYDRGTAVFILAQNVRPGRLDLRYRQNVDPPPDDPSRARSAVKRNDILVTIVGANTGDVCLVPDDLREHYVCQSVALVRLLRSEWASFVMWYLLSEDHGRKQFAEFMYGQGRPHLSFEQLRSTRVALPPIAEQHRIVAEIGRRLSIVDEIAASIDVSLARSDRLRQAVLKRAFEGKLVPQDPRDEPASVLLERIRKERESLAADRPAKGKAGPRRAAGLRKRRKP